MLVVLIRSAPFEALLCKAPQGEGYKYHLILRCPRFAGLEGCASC
jgi:hypothetical protein